MMKQNQKADFTGTDCKSAPAGDGRKLGKKLYNSQHSLLYDERYYDELLIKDGAPSRIQHDEGFITLNQAGQPVHFCYYLKDHLGNVRSVIYPSGGQPVIKQANDYYPFGMSYSNAPGANKPPRLARICNPCRA